jgi:uncharacterized protein YcsI (UPF0317 family)
MFYYVRFSFEKKEEEDLVESFVILCLFVGHSKLLHMAFEIRFVTDGMEVSVQAGRRETRRDVRKEAVGILRKIVNIF